MKNSIIHFIITCVGIGLTFAQKADLKLDRKTQIKNKNKLEIQQKKTAIAFNEADMFQMYYPKGKKDIQAKKKVILKRIKKGDKQAERDLKVLKTKESELNARYKKALKFSKLNEQIYLKIGPIPPCPRPRDCGNDWLRNLETVIVATSVKNIRIVAVNKEGQTIGMLKKNHDLHNKDIGFKTFSFNWKSKTKGPITFRVKRIFNNGLKESYDLVVK
ncbi:hypothetical protein [Spongiivirga citrea]|uniref:Uncharacterized protein n=1 Tax=Spongiivirga citrea TaxID=1481457 RepID=A0A6M0CYB2_9FLAO|nr:hypothetical protein [Spongiivirga citrea]NER18690.1 hypothetical protein [Spongiivirga citrea]